ncbi:ABC transporter ATP-binding protein [Mesorhizobium sp.]|uniref:ABC transporter ATP-binding protein n=1 Tax=Mesorhizobium sp. TaxID=1871066 RepID=UPI000FE667B1|nr:ABC transporter ATP-binding protein [Mesorhizobium sp.]RWG01603.1 MAG: ABC transporter ATP-binding protein [Mesorhizobium sp.]
MGSLNIENVKKAFGPVEVLKGIDLEVNDGEFVVFVGPSGCGKSTLLRVIAGLEDSTSGRVVIDGDDVSVTPPAKRGIAMVFQTYALYPHLTVKNNMGLGLKQAGTPSAEIERRIKIASAMLSLEPYLERRPAELSGGQRQRVAIGRAVVREPKLFLFDEPLSNLDAALRVNTRLEIAQLHRRLKATMIYVTHDQVEAMTLADKIVVLNAGRIEQIGSPMELYNAPANEFVAGFIGGAKLGETAKTVGVRPEHLTVDAKSGAWKGTVVHAEHLGADTNLYLDCEKAGLLTVRIFGVYNAEPGATLYATPDPAKTYRFGADGRVLK